MPPEEKKQVEKITITQPSAAGEEVVASSWEEADEIIGSFIGPGSVVMTLDFGTEKIEYIFDSMDSAMPLCSAVRRWLEFLANKTRPPWIDEEDWDDFKIGNEDSGAETYQGMLETLDI